VASSLWYIVFHEKLTVTQLVMKFLAFMEAKA